MNRSSTTTRTVLTLAIAAGIALTACGSDDDDSADSPTAATAGATGENTAPADGTTAAGEESTADGATVMVATHPDLGEHLVDADGLTLYLFTQDQGTTTACTGACADNWPPLVADGEPTGGDGVDTALLSTADGILPDQVTYDGHLLYSFAGDDAPGDTNGVGLPDWYAVDPSGEAIDAG